MSWISGPGFLPSTDYTELTDESRTRYEHDDDTDEATDTAATVRDDVDEQ